MVDDHFEALQDTVHLREEPRQRALYNASWGVIPTLRVGLQAVKENHRQFLHMQPDQLLVEGSTAAVTRSLLPFVQNDSPYLRMRKTAARETLRALQDLALAKHLWIHDGDEAISMYLSVGFTATDKQGGLAPPIASTPCSLS